MAPSKVILLLGLAIVAVVLISSEAVSARDLAEETVATDSYGGHGGYGREYGHGKGGYGSGKGHGGGYEKGRGGYGHGGKPGYGGKPGHGGHPGHGAAEETETGNN